MNFTYNKIQDFKMEGEINKVTQWKFNAEFVQAM